jgi:3-oxoadipate CoA-transferase beta subunit
VITQHVTKQGQPKLLERCTFPLTGVGVVSRIYSDLAVVDVSEDGFKVVELAPGVDFDYVQERTGAPLQAPD